MKYFQKAPNNTHLLPPLLASMLIISLSSRADNFQFTEIDPLIPKISNPCIVCADYDRDGDLDLLVAGIGKVQLPYTAIYNNNGGVFTHSGIDLVPLSQASAAWGDFNNDGYLDLAMTGLSSEVGPITIVYRNDHGTFTPVFGNFTGVFGGSIAWGDYDRDGDLDLLVTGALSTAPDAPALTQLYRNDGDSFAPGGSFTAVTQPFPDCYGGAVAWGDYDADGWLDVIITGTSKSGPVSSLWHNDGGTFTEADVKLPGVEQGFAVWGDYDNDGDLDLLLGGASNDGAISQLYRNDKGVFQPVDAKFQGLVWASAAWGDYDNDGDLDAMIIGYDPLIKAPRSILYRNDKGTFAESGESFQDVYLGTASWLDYNNDGALDLLLAGNNGAQDVLRLYRNRAKPNIPPSAPDKLIAKVTGTSVELSWNPAVDSETPTAGLTYNLRVGTKPLRGDVVSPHSADNGYRQLPDMGNAYGTIGRVVQLTPGTTYFWSVQAVDTAFEGSPFAFESSFYVPIEAPRAYTDAESR